MQQINKPSKEAIRKWLALTIEAHHPPPSPERIREMLGWRLMKATRKTMVER
jgi:DNA-directed RNA polymerase specialized sigma54-like protein